MNTRSDITPIRRVSARKYRGLGDVVAAAAKPIARQIDKRLKTDLEHCKGCGRRQDDLNRAVPFKGDSD